MAFPFLFLTLAFIIGILIGSFYPLDMAWLILSILILLSAAWIFYLLPKKNKPALVLVLAATCMLGTAIYTQTNHYYMNNSLKNFPAEDYVDLEGTIYKSPSRGSEQDYLYIKLRKIYHHNKTTQVSGNLRLSVRPQQSSSSYPDLLVHDKVRVSARLLTPREYFNFQSSYYADYLKTNHIHRLAYTKSPQLIEKLTSGPKISIRRIFSTLRRQLQAKIELLFPADDPDKLSSQGAVMEALILGERERMTEGAIKSLQEAGLFHLFAISGAHIALMSFFIFLFLRTIRIPERTSYLLLIICLVFYALLIEGRPSVMRATIMTLVFLLGKLLWKDVNLINSISLSAFILLLFNPFSLFSLGFQLTFAATFAIILFYPKIVPKLPRLPLRISEIFAMTLGAQLGVLPLVVSAFNRVALASLILNYLALPLIAMILAGGYLMLFLSFIMLPAAHFLSRILHFLIDIFLAAAGFGGHFSFLSYRIPGPHPIVLGLFYLSLLFLLTPQKRNWIKTGRLVFFLLCLIVLLTYPFSSAVKDLRITFIDVGQGDSILVELPGTKKMLIDGGGSYTGSFDTGERVVSPFLWGKGIKKIDFLLLTHFHPDHYGGIPALANNFRVGEFWEGSRPYNNKKYQAFKESLPKNLDQKIISKGYYLNEAGVKMQVLHPTQAPLDSDSLSNDLSLVLRLEYGSISFLLTGDIEQGAEEEIAGSFPDLASRVLKSPHHGSRTSSSAEFLTAVAPKIIIISVGKNNIYRLPNPQVLNSYHNMGATVYRTDLHGAVEFVSDGKSISVRTAVPTE